MICEICGKNIATIHIQEIINSKKKVLHICQECAAKKEAAKEMLSGLDLAQLMFNISSDLSTIMSDGNKNKISVPPLIKCSRCGWDMIKFTSSGRLGCAQCFTTFRPILDQAIKNMHKGCIHIGKKPGHLSVRSDEINELVQRIEALSKKLEGYVQNEEYEKAAQTRDLIAELKSKIESKSSEAKR